MDEFSIKVTIANRIYPLTIARDEEEKVRKVTKLIQEKLRLFEQNYAGLDKQDLLAMCCLQFATEAFENEGKANEGDSSVKTKLLELDKFISDILEKN